MLTIWPFWFGPGANGVGLPHLAAGCPGHPRPVPGRRAPSKTKRHGEDENSGEPVAGCSRSSGQRRSDGMTAQGIVYVKTAVAPSTVTDAVMVVAVAV